MKVLLIGGKGGTHVGDSLHYAAVQSGHEAQLIDVAAAFAAPKWFSRLTYRVLDHRPPRLGSFSDHVLATAEAMKPDVLLTTGIAPVQRTHLQAIRNGGTKTINFSTDDPWSRNHRSFWFPAALLEYDVIFSPRRSNLADLGRLGCRRVVYLPFAYDPRHSHEVTVTEAQSREFGSDVLFVGGGDRDRLPFATALLRAGIDLRLYGVYWDRFRQSRRVAHGIADPALIRVATATTKVAVCLVRRANRDGHVMRSFEIPAVGACMAVEDTQEHRELFGPDGEAVRYFDGIESMVRVVKELLAAPEQRSRLSSSVHARITRGANTYAHRLNEMMETLGLGDLRSE